MAHVDRDSVHLGNGRIGAADREQGHQTEGPDQRPNRIAVGIHAEIRRRIYRQAPIGRPVGTGIEAGDAAQIIDQVRAERRIDMRLGRKVRIHLLLHQSGVKMAGIDDDQASVRHG